MGADIGTECMKPLLPVRFYVPFIIARPTSELLFEIGVFFIPAFCLCASVNFMRSGSLFLVMP